MKRSSLVLLFLAALGVLGLSKRVPLAARDYSPIDVDANPLLVLDRRFELEMRRAGGPRPEAMEELLKLGADINDQQWGKRVIDACVDRIVDCNEFVGVARVRAQREQRYQESAHGQARRIGEEAALQRMSVKQRRVLYLEALRKGWAESNGIRLDGANAPFRILGERMYDLIGEIEKAWSEGLLAGSDRLGREIEIAKALSSADARERLIALVREGVLQPIDSPKELLAKMALNELRRLNVESTAEELRKMLELYEPAREKQERQARERIEKVRAEGRYLLPGELPDKDAYLGVLGRKIIEAIGDLGDREFERKALGGRTLWDQVNEVERELVRRGKISEKQMVSR